MRVGYTYMDEDNGKTYSISEIKDIDAVDLPGRPGFMVVSIMSINSDNIGFVYPEQRYRELEDSLLTKGYARIDEKAAENFEINMDDDDDEDDDEDDSVATIDEVPPLPSNVKSQKMPEHIGIFD